MPIYDINGNVIEMSGDSTQKSRVISMPNRANPSEFSVGWVNTTVGGSDTLNTSNTGTRTTAAIPATAGQIVSIGYISSYNHNPFFSPRPIRSGVLPMRFSTQTARWFPGQQTDQRLLAA